MSKSTLILLSVLGILAVVEGGILVKKAMTPKTVTESFQDRMAVSGAINHAVYRIQQSDKRWVKNLDELKSEPELKELPSGALQGVSFNFTEVKGDKAFYEMTVDGKKKTVSYPKWTATTGTPTLGGLLKGG